MDNPQEYEQLALSMKDYNTRINSSHEKALERAYEIALKSLNEIRERDDKDYQWSHLRYALEDAYYDKIAIEVFKQESLRPIP